MLFRSEPVLLTGVVHADRVHIDVDEVASAAEVSALLQRWVAAFRDQVAQVVDDGQRFVRAQLEAVFGAFAVTRSSEPSDRADQGVSDPLVPMLSWPVLEKWIDALRKSATDRDAAPAPEAVDEAMEDDPAAVGDSHAEDRSGSAAQDEIGRASCRERV